MLDVVCCEVVHCNRLYGEFVRFVEGYFLSHHHSRYTYIAVVLLIGLFSCTATPVKMDEQAQRQILALLMPARIEIVEPFTRVKSFDDDNTPDGIELILRAVNPLDNPGLMIAGHVRVELYEFIPASADHKGRRLEHWEIELTTAKQQKTYWNQLTQMYEFRLGIDRTKIPQADVYVLVVTYATPLGEYLTDEFVIRYRTSEEVLGGA